MQNEELVKKIKAGDTQLIAELWENCVKLLQMLLNREMTHEKRERAEHVGVTNEDLQQELFFALVNAVKNYDQEKSYKFSSYLSYHVKNAVSRSIGIKTKRAANDPLNLCTSLNSSAGQDDSDEVINMLADPNSEKPFEDFAKKDYNMRLKNDIKNAIVTLPPLQQNIINCFYFKNLTIKKIAEREGTDTQTILREKNKALAALRASKHLKNYRE